MDRVSDPDPSQYDGFAAAYEAHAEAAPYNALYDRPATLELLGDVAGKQVLDAGCGPGIYVEELLNRGAHVLACDGSAQMVELTRERIGGAPAQLRVQSLTEPFGWIGDQAVDTVVCALVYHYLNDRPAFLREMHRILKPDGVVVISTHHATSDWLRLGGSYFDTKAVTETWSTGWEITAWRTPMSTLTEEFAHAGFVIERLVEPQPMPEMQHEFPQAYAKLATSPGFVFFRLLKR